MGWEGFEYKKFLPVDLIERILEMRYKLGIKTPLVRRASCGLSLVNSIPDYNAHRVEGKEKNCFSSCPEQQQARCGSVKIPDEQMVVRALFKMGWMSSSFEISPKRVVIRSASHLYPWDKDHGLDFSVSFQMFDAFALRHLIGFPVEIG
jgi:hypothetical protein